MGFAQGYGLVECGLVEVCALWVGWWVEKVGGVGSEVGGKWLDRWIDDEQDLNFRRVWDEEKTVCAFGGGDLRCELEIYLLLL